MEESCRYLMEAVDARVVHCELGLYQCFSSTGTQGLSYCLLCLLRLGHCHPFPWRLSQQRPFLLNVYGRLFSAGRCWLVAAFLPGLTGRAMTSAFLSSAHCQLRWLSQRKHQGKVAQPGQCAITERGCWQGSEWGTLAIKVSASGQSQECAGLPHPSCFSYSFQYRRKLVGCLLSSQTRNQWHPAPASDSKLTSLSCKMCSSGSACVSPLPSPVGC